MSLATWTTVHLTLSNETARRTLDVVVYDLHPQSFTVRDIPAVIEVRPGQFTDLTYDVRPTERGAFEFEGTEVRVGSPVGFWWRRVRLPLSDVVRVYPNYSTIKKLLAYEVENHLQLAGVRMSRRRGEGIEFHQLRDYREGDSLRAAGVPFERLGRDGRDESRIAGDLAGLGNPVASL